MRTPLLSKRSIAWQQRLLTTCSVTPSLLAKENGLVGTGVLLLSMPVIWLSITLYPIIFCCHKSWIIQVPPLNLLMHMRIFIAGILISFFLNLCLRKMVIAKLSYRLLPLVPSILTAFIWHAWGKRCFAMVRKTFLANIKKGCY